VYPEGLINVDDINNEDIRPTNENWTQFTNIWNDEHNIEKQIINKENKDKNTRVDD